MLNLLTALILFSGAVFIFIAALGLVRMPDVYLRMSTTTKAATLGVGLVCMAVALAFGDLAVSIRVVGIVIFLLLTAPVAAHMLGRAAYRADIPLWEETRLDELKPYDNEVKNEV